MSTSRAVRQLRLQRTSGNTRYSASLTIPSALSTSYRLVLPNGVPTSTQALLSDPSGSLSWASVVGPNTQQSFTAANNITTAANVTGLTATASPTVIPVYVSVVATNNLFAIITLQIYYNNARSTYVLESTSVGDATQVRFDVTSTGQVVYYSGNYAGFTSLTFSWYTSFTPVASTITSLGLSGSLSVGTNTTLGGTAFTGTPSATTGSLLNITATTFTDSSTAASGTASGFNGAFVAAPTVTASNTGVITTTANTLAIGGPPIASTNETFTNAFALNVQSGNSRFNGNVLINNFAIHSTPQQYSARFYLTSNWTPATNWNYLPSTVGLAADLPPSINASVSSTNTGTTINYNTATGLIFLPVSGTWNFNMFAVYTNNVSTSNTYELRLCVFSAPAWPAAGSAAKTNGQNQSASALAGIPQAQLTTTSLITVNEAGFSYTGKFPAGTLVAFIVYSGSGNAVLTSAGTYFEVSLINALT